MAARRLLLLGSLLFAGVAAPVHALATGSDEEAAVKAVLGSYVDADRKQDVDGT